MAVNGGSEEGRERRVGRETRTSLRAVEGVWVQDALGRRRTKGGLRRRFG